MTREATQDTDRELVDAIKSGRPERFTELVERYEGKLYTFGLRMCGDAQDAEDMVQDTFLNVYKYLGGFRGEAKFKNWLYRVATSACSKKKRKSKYAPERELSLEEFYPQEGAPLPAEVPAWACAPLETLLNRELGEVLQDTILELPESYRLVLVLRDRELAQIAQFQGTALGRKVASEVPDYGLEGIAAGLGVEFLPLTTDEEVVDVVGRASSIAESGRPVLVETSIDYSRKTHFTRGVVKTNLLRLPFRDRARFVGRALIRRLTG